jgi:SAM-dependent methyltransferase
MPQYIHGETDPVEVARLEKQARFLSRWILDGVEVGPGSRLLDLACGTGAMARRLRAHFPDATLIGCDLSLRQVIEARRAQRRGDTFALVNCDAGKLALRDSSFEAVHCSWLLEHVPPGYVGNILREVRRVLKPGGRAFFCEVEDDSLQVWPRLPLVEEMFRAVWRAQAEGGGDPIIGRKLHGLCADAGFHHVEVTPTTLHVHAGSPPGYYGGTLEEFAEILESAEGALPPELAGRVAEGAAQLRGLETTPGSSFTYTFFRARAEK